VQPASSMCICGLSHCNWVGRCLGRLSAVLVYCHSTVFSGTLLCTCEATLHQRACKLLAAPAPPAGGLLLTSCCAFAACACFQVIACALRSLSTCLLGLERFPTGGGAPGLSQNVVLHPCLHIVLAMYSEAIACLSICPAQIITVHRHRTCLLCHACISC
jgi:hypothetical protein